MKVFTSTEFQRNPGDIFNAVQSDGQADIKHKARPDMVLVLKDEFDAIGEKVKQLTNFIIQNDMKEHLEIAEAIRNSKTGA